MDRYRTMFIIIAAVIISAAFNPAALRADDSKNGELIATPEQAAKHAARLANEKCQEEFGLSPFKPESYKAEFKGAKWCWGKIDPVGIHGYSAKVEFCKDGSDEKVRVVFHTDKVNDRYQSSEDETRKKVPGVEKVLPESR